MSEKGLEEWVKHWSVILGDPTVRCAEKLFRLQKDFETLLGDEEE